MISLRYKAIIILLLTTTLCISANSARGGEAGTLAGRNLILIQLESFQNFAVGRTVRGAPVTPNLNELIERGLWFSRCYPQTAGGNTSDAEFLANTSLMPASQGAVFERFTAGSYHSLAGILREKGYRTGVFHGNTANVWNRPKMYPALGFERFDARKAYATGLKIGLGLADEPFYAETAKKLASWEEPFFASVISLSSHHPFKIPASVDNFDPAPYAGTVLGDYLRSLHYADRALGQFIDALRTSGLLERSLVVIYGDHGGVPLEERERLEHFLSTEDRGMPPHDEAGSDPDPAFWRAQLQVPLLFLAEGSTLRGRVDAPVGQVDIATTTAALMGFEIPGALGANLAERTPDLVIFRDGGFIKENFWITPGEGDAKLAFDLGAYPRSFPAHGPAFEPDAARILFSAPIEEAARILRSSDAILEEHTPR